MYIDKCRFSAGLIAIAAIAMSGCEAFNRPRVKQARSQKRTQNANVKTAAAADSDVRLFGRSDAGISTGEIVFEGRGVTSREQHTSPAEGADFDPEVSPDGGHIAFASTRHSSRSAIYTKSVSGATVTQITDSGANDAEPSFSPDGQRIAFSSDRSGNWDIWVMDRDGRNAMQITNTPMPELHPSWSPDGRQLVYCRVNTKENRGELWVSSLEGPGVRRLIGEGLFPEWSPSGQRIAYQRARQRGSRWFSIWTLDYDMASGEARFPTEIVSRPESALISPCWSPDGNRIAYAIVTPTDRKTGPGMSGSPRGAARAEIGIVDADGRAEHVVTDGQGEHYGPDWASNGRLYFTVKSEGAETIWSVRPIRGPEAGAEGERQALNEGMADQ